jgi:phytoene dehydrogenase-like protein
MMVDADVIVVGAGLTGLRAASELIRGGASVLILERDVAVGGRLRTSLQDGYILDHGFQVLLSAYPEFKLIPDFHSLRCRPFQSGARVQLQSQCYDLLDYRSGPSGLMTLLKAPFFSLSDLARLGVFSLVASSHRPLPTGSSTLDDLTRLGFSREAVNCFLSPFLGGVLLDRSLSIDSGAARFYMGMFARGRAILPESGIQALPELLASSVGNSHILLSSAVTQISANQVVLQSGETLVAKQVLCAVDGLASSELGGSAAQTMPYGGCTTIYFAAEYAPYQEPLLFLNGSGSGVINHLAVPSNVQPSYAPKGRALIAITVVGREGRREDISELVRREAAQWFGKQVDSWQLLRSFSITAGVPLRSRFTDGWTTVNGVYYAGDYLSYGSQNGALAAGRSVARAILEELR